MKVGSYHVSSFLTCRFGLDGGSMFGVVPKALWDTKLPSDERNRIPMVTRVLLVRNPQQGVSLLVDVGMGARWGKKERKIYALEDLDLPGQLNNQGVNTHDVTHVLVTHLHFDHAGGLSHEREDGAVVPIFHKARHFVSKKQWEWANAPSKKDRGSYRPLDFQPVLEAGLFDFVDSGEGSREVLPNVFVGEVSGHTPGMWVVRIGTGEGAVVFCADLFPTRFHLKPHWNMAFDNQPLKSISEKSSLLNEAFEKQWVLVLEHDPEVAAVRLTDVRGGFEEVSLE